MRASPNLTFCACLLAFEATAATVPPELEVLPTTIELPSPAIPADFVLVLRNPSDQPLEKVTLSWIASGEFAVTANSPLELGAFPPHAEIAWNLRVARKNEDVVPGALHFRIDYTTIVQGRPAAQILLVSVKVTTREREPAGNFLDVQVATSLVTLESSRAGSLNLLFTNKTGRPVVIEKVTANYPDFLNLELASAPGLSIPRPAPKQRSWPSWWPDLRKLFIRRPALPERHALQLASAPELTIPPHGTKRQEYVVTANESVETGKYLLIFDILFRSPEGGATPDRTMVVSRELTVGVLGESAISKAVGLGSFLLAPGWLSIMTAWLMFDNGLLRKKTVEKFFVEIGKSEFWLVAVFISLAFAGVVKLFTKRWYFVRYGLEDIVWVWMISIGLGALSYVTVEATKRWKEAQEEKKWTTPVGVLKKLAAQGLPLVLDRVSLKDLPGHIEPGFLIEKDGKDLDPAWVSPKIVINYEKLGEAQTSWTGALKRLVSRAETLQKRVEDTVNSPEISEDKRPKELAALLRQCPAAVTWDSEPIREPHLVPKKDREPADGRDSIIKRE
jgi:hypothetical protein